MAIELNHTIVPCLDKEASAMFFARIFGLRYDGPAGHFAPVQVNEGLTLDFDNARELDSHHLAFKVSDGEFDAIFGRVQAEGIRYDQTGFTPAAASLLHIGPCSGTRAPRRAAPARRAGRRTAAY